MNLGAWLRKTPQPTIVDVDGKKVTVPLGGGKWRDMVRTIESLKGERLTALDASGNVIRALTIDDAEEEKPTEQKPASDLQVLAKLVAEAYDKKNLSMQPVLDSAMQMIERLSSRLSKAESEMDKLRLENSLLRGNLIETEAAAEAAVAAASNGDDGLVGALISGMQQGAAEKTQPIPIKSKGATK